MMWICIGLVVAAAVWPLAAEFFSRRTPPKTAATRRTAASVAAIAILISTLAVGLADSTHPYAPTNRPVSRLDAATAFESEAPGDGFVGSQACRACHPSEHASWHDSFHRTMTRAGTDAQLAAPTVKPAKDFELHGETYRAETRGESLWVGQPGALRRVVQSTGSHHFQAFWVPSGSSRELDLFPFCFQMDTERWVPIDSVFVMPPGTRQSLTGGRWNTSCQMCHATGARPGLDRGRTMDTTVAEFGIACEACHGPGQQHVDANRSPVRRYARHWAADDDEPDPTIVNPRHLSPQRSAETCGQCHALTLVTSDNAERWRDTGFEYRPGQELEASRVVIRADCDHPDFARITQQDPGFLASKFWSDGVIRVTGREYNGLLESPCFANADPEDPSRVMTCLSCHAMHQDSADPRTRDAWANDQLHAWSPAAHSSPREHSNTSCTQCHPNLAEPDALAAHTHHSEASSGSQCINCHMSYTSYGLQKVVRSHTIESPSVETALRTGRPNACNQCHLDQSLGWTARHLHDWFDITPPPELTPDQESVAASVLWTLKGDAGQRVLMAWNFGWAEARAVSGNVEWMRPFLAELMRDPYDAVRAIAGRSAKTMGLRRPKDGWDYLDSPGKRDAITREIERDASAARVRPEPNEATLTADNGSLLKAIFDRLLAARDHRPVFLTE